MKKAEDAVFDTLFNFTYDQAGFQKAIKERIGGKKDITNLKRQIANNKKSLSKIEHQLDELVDLRTSGDIEKDRYEKKRYEYMETKSYLMETIAKFEGRLASWLESEKFKEDALDVRHKILDEIKSSEYMKNMSYSVKVDLLNYFFSGWDDDNRKYGIYVQKNADGDFELELYGRYVLGPDRYGTIKRRRTLYTFTARINLEKEGVDLERHKERLSKYRYQTMSAGGGHQPRQSGPRENHRSDYRGYLEPSAWAFIPVLKTWSSELGQRP
ncbi:MAG: hypothetical protein JRE14_09485 [Deltaproteobacteria bacterium]|nr:hypothetical protein [Deltaproteobacteria bacterium]